MAAISVARPVPSSCGPPPCGEGHTRCRIDDLGRAGQGIRTGVGWVRGGGIGRRLIAHVYGEAAARGCSRVWWLTHESNTDAMALYDRVASKSGFLQYRKLL